MRTDTASDQMFTALEPWRAVVLGGVCDGLGQHASRPVGAAQPRRLSLNQPKERKTMSVVKIIELVGSSTTSSDDAVQQALAEARQSLRNIKAVDVVSTGLRGDDLDEWRAHVRVAFLIERVQDQP